MLNYIIFLLHFLIILTIHGSNCHIRLVNFYGNLILEKIQRQLWSHSKHHCGSHSRWGYAHTVSNQDTVYLSSVTCLHPTQGFNFSGIFLHHIVAWPSGNLPTNNTKIVQEDHPSERVKQEVGGHVWLSHLLMSFLFIFF